MSKVTTIELVFDVPIEITAKVEEMFGAILEEITHTYESKNPTRVMWPSGGGQKMILNEPHEPTFDDSVLQLCVSEREDFYGRNARNPDGERLRAESAARKDERNRTNRKGASTSDQ